MLYLRFHFLALTALLLVGGLLSTANAEEEQAVETPETAAAPTPGYTLVWNAPRSLQTLVDERRDALRDRREALHDSLRKNLGISSPWMDQERELWRAYSDQQQAAYRLHRDAMKFRHDQWRAFYMPWHLAIQKAAEARQYELAMENLDRQETMDELRYVYQPTLGAPFLW